MKKLSNALPGMAGASGWFASCGDFVVTFVLGAQYPGYHFMQQTESYLGANGSPVATSMNVWGVVFCLLLLFFAYGLRKTMLSTGLWPTVAIYCIAVYGLGEGMGSGLFPHNYVNGILNFAGQLHDVFGALAGVAIVILPFAGAKIFSATANPRMHRYSWFVFISGLITVVIFLLAKEDLVPLKGLWQRLFILDYHVYLAVLATVLISADDDQKDHEGR